VRTELQVFRVDEIHPVGRRRATDTAVEVHVAVKACAEILEGGEASATGVGRTDTLDGLQAFQIQAVVVVVGDDHVGTVGAANQLHSHTVHVALNVGRSRSRAAVGRCVKRHVTPEGPGCAVDAAVGAGAGSGGDGSSQTHDILATVTRSVRIQACADLVHQLGFCNLNAAFQQVDDLLFARVLQHFQTADRHGSSVLLDVILGGRDGAVGGDVDGVIARIRTRVQGVGVVIHDLFQDHVTAREGLDVATLAHFHEQGVVAGDVIGQRRTTGLNGRGDDVGQTCEGSHDSIPFQLSANCAARISRNEPVTG